jgi:serine protease
MRRTSLPLVAALAATLLLPLAAQTPMAQGTTPVVANKAYARVIVKYKADSELMQKHAMTLTGLRMLQTGALAARIGISLSPGHSLSDRSHVVTAQGITSSALAARLAAQGDVEYAVVDERKHIVAVPNDPFYGTRAATASSGGPLVGQWYLKPPGAASSPANTAPAAINAEQAWDITTGVPGIVVAVLDTGLRFDHPDLQGGNVLPGYDMVSADGNGTFVTANDGNGRDPDASDPGDGVTDAEVAAATDPSDPLFNCTPEASSWHGTQTLGLIGAATNNNTGIASVGRGVGVMPVRVLGKCGGYDSDIVAGILWASGIHVPGIPDNPNPARVINMSLGATGGCKQLYVDAVAQANAKGVVVVASAGNSAGHPVGEPANCPGVIAVTALRHVGDKVGFSDLGPEITISAPGGNCINTTTGSPCLYPIMTTANSGALGPVPGAAGAIYTDSFGTASLGTSFSAPLVAGTVALMMSARPGLTVAEAKSALQATARPFPTTGGTDANVQACVAPVAGVDQLECYCTAGLCGAGMLDAHAAVAAVSAGAAVGVLARISVTTANPAPAAPVTIASTSVIGAGQTATYAWSIVSAGTTGAVITGASDQATVTVTPATAGTFTVGLTVTDGSGHTSTTSTPVTVAAPVVASPPSSGGGGGALGVGWLAMLLAAVLALAAASRLERRRLARVVSDPAPAARRR